MEDVMLFGPFGPVDEDDPRFQAMKEAQDRAHATAEDLSNRIWDLLNGLGTDNLTTLSQLLQQYATSHNPSADIHYTLGEITAILKLKYDVCPGCGKDHTKDLSNWTLPPVTPEPEPIHPVPASREELMQKYRVREGSGDGRVQCTDCGIMYPSLIDRMERNPETCHGCNLKSAHG